MSCGCTKAKCFETQVNHVITLQPQIILERHFLGISIYKSMTTNKGYLQQYKHVLSINKTIKPITKRNLTWVALLSGWSVAVILQTGVNRRPFMSKNVKFSFVSGDGWKCCQLQQWVNYLDWFLDMFRLALHTLLSSCTVSQVLIYYTLPLTRQPQIYLFFYSL